MSIQRIFFITLLFTSNVSLAAEKILTLSSQNTYFTKVCEKIVSSALIQEGIKVKYERLPSPRALETSNSGSVGGELCRVAGVNKKWPNLIMIKPAVSQFYGAIFTNAKVRKNITGWPDLKGLRVGIRRGHIYSRRGTAKLASANIFEISTTKQLLDMLELNRIDAAVLIRHNALEIIFDDPGKYLNVKLSNANIGEYKAYIYLHKSKMDIIDQVTKATLKSISSGNSSKIYQSHIKKHETLLNALLLH